MSRVYSTPGVYIEERDAFPNSVVPVATAVPAFIGYTEYALRGRKSLLNVPTRVTSFAEFIELFGGPPRTTFSIAADATVNYKLTVDEGTQYYLYRCMQLFYSNGGGDCYIVSVGDYSKGVKSGELNNLADFGGLQALLKEQEPTMVVIPDAVLLPSDECYSLQQAMLLHCGGEMRSRIALLDVHDGHLDLTKGDDVIKRFREGVGMNFLQFGAAYYPWLNTTIMQPSEISYKQISNLDDFADILLTEVNANLAAKFIKEGRAEEIKAVIAQLKDRNADTDLVSNTLKAVSPIFKEVISDLLAFQNVLPPSAAMAGVLTMVDNAVGVHKAPANVSVSAVKSPTVNISNDSQEDLNLPLSGKAVNAIRSFVGKGVLCWGARTLDGNSQDWRYINVRRTLIMIEQSVKIAAEAYVFEPNDANTWLSIKSMLNNFLVNQWRSGALVGAVPEDAFTVDVGLGVTMSPQDVLDGVMRINVKVAVSRPAEFIVITFQQQMQKS